MVDYTKKKKKDYPERQFTATSALNDYFSRLQEDENDKRAMNIVHNLYMLQNPNYSGSSEAAYNQKLISGTSSSSSATGLATRYRLMGDADKERVSAEFTVMFQDWMRENPGATLEEFNKKANEWGPWYSIELRKQHAATVVQQEKEFSRKAKEERDIQTYEAGLLKEEEKDAVAVASDKLANKYAYRYQNQGADVQSRLMADMQREIDDSNLPSELKSSVFTETIKILKEAYGFKGDVKAEILAAEDKALQKQRAERKWNLGDRHPQQWWADTKASMVFRELMEETKDIETDFERAQKIQELKRIKLVQGQDAGINEEELDSLLASAGFPNQPYASNAYNRLMEGKQLMKEGRFEDVYMMYDERFAKDPAFNDWQENARRAGIYKIISNIIPDWPKKRQEFLNDWKEYTTSEFFDKEGKEVYTKEERNKFGTIKLEELSKKYKLPAAFLHWVITKRDKSIWGIGASIMLGL